MKRSKQQLHQMIRHLLESPDQNAATKTLLGLPPRRVTTKLFSCLCSSDDNVKWHVVTAMGKAVARLAEENMESARNIMRRLIWSLNEESGSIGWGAPEAMGEIMACNQKLANEYARLLVSYIKEDENFLEHEVLQRGAVWGLGRIAQVRPHLVQDAAASLQIFLQSPDAVTRGLAAWTAGLLGAREARPLLENLLDDHAEITLYLDQKFHSCRISELAQQALASLCFGDL